MPSALRSLPLPRSALALSLLGSLLGACSDGDQGFSNAEDQGTSPVGTATMLLNPAELVFTDLIYEGETGAISTSLVFEIQSVGDGNLTVSSVSLSADGGGVFYVEDREDLTIASGSAHEVTVVATLRAFEMAEGEVRLLTNDKDQLDARFPLTAYPVGWTGEGDSGL
jgi:hypothetical protein